MPGISNEEDGRQREPRKGRTLGNKIENIWGEVETGGKKMCPRGVTEKKA